MRPVNLADIEAGVMVLIPVPADERSAFAQRICWQAKTADSFRKRENKPHPAFGTGTLLSACARYPSAARQAVEGRDYLPCLQLLVTALLEGDDHKSV